MNTKLKRVKNKIIKLAGRNKVRVRFAPSPTGFLHIGGLRTAFYNYLFAKKNKGKFILRIEDTDRTRFVAGGTENIMRTLFSIGLRYDEGPVFKKGKIIEKGKFGPYFQSKRLSIYQKYAFDLIRNGGAYRCFCDLERLDALRRKQEEDKRPFRYDRKCLTLPKKEIDEHLRRGEKFVVRQRMPEKGETVFEDIIHGAITTKNEILEDHILLKRDGFPTYNFANVIDDHLMKITHVIRGEEFISSTPKHILLYNFFGWTLPKFAHLPLLLNPDRSKLSKRQGDVAAEDYLKKGYLPEALLNFVALLGWNPTDDKEIFSLKTLVKMFELKKINKSGAVFNPEKLDWFNGVYLRALKLNKFLSRALPFLIAAGILKKKGARSFAVSDGEKITKKTLKKIVALEQERIKHLDELPEAVSYFFETELHYDPASLVWKKSAKPETRDRIIKLEKFLEDLPAGNWNEGKLESIIKAWIKDRGYGNGEVLWPFRVALTGREASPPPFAVAEILGKQKTLFRLQKAEKILSQ